jgi:hypothetical protein
MSNLHPAIKRRLVRAASKRKAANQWATRMQGDVGVRAARTEDSWAAKPQQHIERDYNPQPQNRTVTVRVGAKPAVYRNGFWVEE